MLRQLLKSLTRILSLAAILGVTEFSLGNTEAFAAAAPAAPVTQPAPDAAAPRTPVNQVFQFMQSAVWTSGTQKTNSTVYLWIPENCTKLRGLVLMCTNVPEHMLVNHPAIRDVCAANNLGIIWGVPSFWAFHIPEWQKRAPAFLLQMLDGLAKSSGYEEVATVPWLPVGESGHLLMVTGLLDEATNRCIAGICVKNPQFPKDRTVPLLWTLGTGQEWGQEKSDIRTGWNNVDNPKGWGNHRGGKWPLSGVAEAGTGHFYCSDRMARYFAKYINAAVKERLSDDGGPTLKPVVLEKGFLAHLQLPGRENEPITPYSASAPNSNRLWFFDKELAEEAQAIARSANWKAETQFPCMLDAQGKPLPYSFNGINNLNASMLKMEPDGLTFGVRAILLDQIPAGFIGAGSKLAKTPGDPTIEWECGAFAPAGPGKFRIALDRTWGTGAAYLIMRKPGDGKIRDVVQPCGLDMRSLINKEGQAQTIAFDKIPDVKAGTPSVLLSAKSSAGLPVEFYVVAGPAIIEGGKIVFTKIPPRAKLPLEVTVAAWQWGRAAEPRVKTAEVVKQTFRIIP